VIDAAATNIDGFHRRDIRVFELKWLGLLGANTAYLHLETSNFQEVSLSKLSQFSQWKMCYMLLLLIQMIFFQEIHEFLQLSWIVLFGNTWAIVPLENYDLHEIFLSK
jgi:hypothetical protein